MRDFQLPGRSTVHTLNGMVASSHPLATGAALDVLKSGGNAVDAAICAAAVLNVVEPQSTGIGGDMFALYAPKGEKIIGINGSGHAPMAASADWFRERGINEIPLIHSPHCVTVPGAVDAWTLMVERFGTRDFGSLLQPAIRYAEQGFVVAPRVGYDWRNNEEKLRHDPHTAATYLPAGRAPVAGEVMRFPALGATLRTIAREGRDGFYKGRVAEDIVNRLRALGGLHTLDDFARTKTEVVTSLSSTYKGFDVHQCPPNGPGITVLMMLQILAGFDLARLAPLSVDRLHLESEATRLAYAARRPILGDPRLAKVQAELLLKPEFIGELRQRIRPDRALEMDETSPPAHPETIYLCVVDKDRNAISFINSIAFAFGSGLVSPNTGVLLQNRGVGFNIEAGHVNCIAPGKRPLHTIIPGMLMKNGRVQMAYGVMGGQYQPVGHTHVLTNIIDYGMDLQEAIDCPRGFHFDGVYALERGVGDDVAQGLAALGHKVTRAPHPHGGGQSIWIDWDKGTLTGASDPRKDGCALGY